MSKNKNYLTKSEISASSSDYMSQAFLPGDFYPVRNTACRLQPLQSAQILTKLLSMNFNLDPVTSMYRLGFPYGYLRTGKTSSRKSGTTVVVSFTPEGTNKLLQAKALNELADKVTKLSELIDSFAFPEGNDPKLFRTATVSETDKVSVEAAPGAGIKTHELDIDSIAKSKTFKSKVLSSNEETVLSNSP